jgi:hypothetical protein
VEHDDDRVVSAAIDIGLGLGGDWLVEEVELPKRVGIVAVEHCFPQFVEQQLH